jgi:aminocarboxymuconate-semialdehyde decarboxylase
VSPSPNQTYYWTEAASAPSLPVSINDRIAEIVATWPDRFVGLGTVPLQDAGLASRSSSAA